MKSSTVLYIDCTLKVIGCEQVLVNKQKVESENNVMIYFF